MDQDDTFEKLANPNQYKVKTIHQEFRKEENIWTILGADGISEKIRVVKEVENSAGCKLHHNGSNGISAIIGQEKHIHVLDEYDGLEMERARSKIVAYDTCERNKLNKRYLRTKRKIERTSGTITPRRLRRLKEREMVKIWRDSEISISKITGVIMSSVKPKNGNTPDR